MLRKRKGEREDIKMRKRMMGKRCAALFLSFLLIVSTISASFSVFFPHHAHAETQVPVSVRIEGYAKTLVPKTETATHVYDLTSDIGANPSSDKPLVIHAVVQALKEQGIDVTDQTNGLKVGSGGNYISMIGGEKERDITPYSGWMYQVNGSLPGLGVGQYEVTTGDDIVLYFMPDYTADISITTLQADKTIVAQGEPLTVSLTGKTAGWGAGDTTTIPNASITVNGVEKGVTNAQGEAQLQFEQPGSYTISAERTNSNNIKDIIRPVPLQVTVTAKESGGNSDTPTGTVSVADAIDKASQQILSKGTVYDWEVIGLARAGKAVPASYLTEIETTLRQEQGDFNKVTDYERMSLGIKAAGGDPTNIAGYNLIEKIYMNERMLNQGINGPVYGLIALDAGNYQTPENATWNRDKLLQEIIKQQKNDGGFSLFGSKGDADITGMVLTALAPYTDRSEIKTASERAIEWLSSQQQPHGGYTSAWGEDSSESVSQAIIALTAHGIDPTGESFTKSGKNLIDKLMTFQQSDGGFAHSPTGKTNGMATEQALQALVAYDLYTNGKGRLYSFVKDTPAPEPNPAVQANVRIEGPEGQVTAGEITATTAMEGVEKLLTAKNIPHNIKDTSLGKYISSISGITEGKYGGYDGWMFAVVRDGKWIIPTVGMSEYVLKKSDQVVVYYGGENTQLVDAVTVQPEKPKANEAFTVTVLKTTWDWQAGKQVTVPAADVQVAVGNTVQKANAQGIASFINGVGEGTHTITVSQYHSTQAPDVVRSTASLAVAASGTDPGGGGGGVPVPAKKITLSVTGDNVKGSILPATSMELREGDTAYTVLSRQLGSKVKARGSNATIYVESIDGLSEFDRGPQSGWMYSVNGTFPNYSAGSYTLQAGDVVAWRYTLNLGKDLGAELPGSSPVTPGTSTPSIPAQTENEITKIGLAIDNTQPIDKVGKTTAILNASERMSAAQAAQLQSRLSAHLVSVKQTASNTTETVMSDGEREVRLVIPSQAMSTQTSISIEEQASERVGLISGLYDFKPDGTKFNKPVYISIKVPVQTDQPENLALVWLDEKTNKWIPIPAVLDVKTGVITGKVNHFTKFAVIDRSKLEDKKSQTSVAVEIEAASKQILNSGSISDWEAFALARAGQTVPAGYLFGVEKLVKEKKGDFRKITDYERIALAVKAMGGNPENIAGYNFIEKIYNSDRMTSQGTNGPTFALLVLDSGNYTIAPQAKWTKDKLVEWILQQQNKDGSFPLMKGEEGNVDITAMILAALSPYQARPEVKKSAEQAIEWLSKMQLQNGGYKLFGDENSESVSQVIIGLSSFGINPKDKRFVKPGGDLLTNLLRFKNNDGGYAHVIGQATNDMATEQALMALVAYEQFTKGEGKLYEMSAVTPPPTQTQAFIDDQAISAWALASVYKARDAELMGSMSTTELRFAPKETMTRAQFVAILLNVMNEAPATNAKSMFTDVKPGQWHYGHIMKAKQMGIIQGVTPTLFKPDQPINRQEMATMITGALQLDKQSKMKVFKDQKKIHAWSMPHVQAVYKQKIMVGYNDYFQPLDKVTREMGAVVAVQLYEIAHK